MFVVYYLATLLINHFYCRAKSILYVHIAFLESIFNGYVFLRKLVRKFSYGQNRKIKIDKNRFHY